MNETNCTLPVLITGAGSVYGQGILRSLKESMLPIETIAIDTNPYSLGLFAAHKSFIAPKVSKEDSYYSFIKNLCINHHIKAIFIGSTAELSFYSRNKEVLERATGVKVFVNPPKVLELCNDKWLTMCHLSQSGFQVPKTIRYPEDADLMSSFTQSAGFPLIVKPRFGRGSVGVVLVKNNEQLLEYIKDKRDLIIQEYIKDEDEEYTVGICINRSGKVISKIALRRYLLEGVSIAAVSSKDYEHIADYCARVSSTLGAFGAMNIQLRLKDSQPVIFEINPRFSSSTGMRLLLGVNEPESLIRAEVLCEDVMPTSPRAGVVLRQFMDYYFSVDEFKAIFRDGVH